VAVIDFDCGGFSLLRCFLNSVVVVRVGYGGDLGREREILLDFWW
jgi:hypothetical protein